MAFGSPTLSLVHPTHLARGRVATPEKRPRPASAFHCTRSCGGLESREPLTQPASGRPEVTRAGQRKGRGRTGRGATRRPGRLPAAGTIPSVSPGFRSGEPGLGCRCAHTTPPRCFLPRDPARAGDAGGALGMRDTRPERGPAHRSHAASPWPRSGCRTGRPGCARSPSCSVLWRAAARRERDWLQLAAEALPPCRPLL